MVQVYSSVIIDSVFNIVKLSSLFDVIIELGHDFVLQSVAKDTFPSSRRRQFSGFT